MQAQYYNKLFTILFLIEKIYNFRAVFFTSDYLSDIDLVTSNILMFWTFLNNV